MSEDFLHALRIELQDISLNFTPDIYNKALTTLDDCCLLISNDPLTTYGMPSANRDLIDRDVQREISFNVDELNVLINENIPKLLLEQKTNFDRVNDAKNGPEGGIFIFTLQEVQ